MSDDTKDEEVFSLKLQGEGINIERSVDRQTALAIVAALMGGVPFTAPAHATANTSPANAPPASTGAPVSMREFLTESCASTHSERITTIGLFLRRYKGQDTFTKDDIVTAYRAAHEPPPKNIPRDLGTTIKSAWIEESGEAGRYYVTNTGERTVDSKFGHAGKSAA